jgi:hypothetical protein
MIHTNQQTPSNLSAKDIEEDFLESYVNLDIYSESNTPNSELERLINNYPFTGQEGVAESNEPTPKEMSSFTLPTKGQSPNANDVSPFADTSCSAMAADDRSPPPLSPDSTHLPSGEQLNEESSIVAAQSPPPGNVRGRDFRRRVQKPGRPKKTQQTKRNITTRALAQLSVKPVSSLSVTDKSDVSLTGDKTGSVDLMKLENETTLDDRAINNAMQVLAGLSPCTVTVINSTTDTEIVPTNTWRPHLDREMMPEPIPEPITLIPIQMTNPEPSWLLDVLDSTGMRLFDPMPAKHRTKTSKKRLETLFGDQHVVQQPINEVDCVLRATGAYNVPGPDLGPPPFSAGPHPRSRVHASVPTPYKINVFSTRTFFLITKLLPSIILIIMKPYCQM